MNTDKTRRTSKLWRIKIEAYERKIGEKKEVFVIMK